MAERKKKNDATLPFAALQLLAPPVRLVSAALWKVMKQRDVMQYGVVEEFVTSACETVPGLLTVRHQGKLALGLRGRLILELCYKHPDEKLIMSHLARIRAPAALSSSSDHIMKRDVKILRTVESFHLMVHALLTDAAEREEFFKEEFPVDYGPEFDLELEKLLWEFLIRLDQLLPVPNLTQTVAWLSDAPAVLEECACAATQPQLLKILLQHQTCLGHLETAASLPPNMGDSILASLSLPPSGKVPSRAKMSARESSEGTQAREETPFITPVFGIISSEDVPALISTNKGTQRGDDVTKENSRFTMVKQKQNSKDCDEEQTEEMNASKRSSGIKRKHPDSQESDEEAEVCRKSAEKETRRSLTKMPSGLDRSREEDGAVGNVCNREAVEIRVRLPEDPSLRSVFVSCLRSQPRVVLKKLPKTSDGTSTTSAWRKPPRIKGQDQRTESKGRAPAHERTSSRSQKPEAAFPGPDNKENRPVLVGVSASQQRRNTGTSTLTGDGDDYVADSEDEATKNFKDRLFLKRYCKTKHGTYVPTLREYFRPRTARRHLLTAGGKHR